METLHSYDVSRSTLVGHSFKDSVPGEYLGSRSNSPAGIGLIIEQAKACEASLVVEATGQDHVELCLAALEAKVPVAVVDPHGAKLFRQSMKQRSKTDKIDARQIGSYAIALAAQGRLRYLEPVDRDLLELKALLRKRHALVNSRMQLSMAGIEPRVLAGLTEEIRRMEGRIKQLCRSHGRLFDRLFKLPGIDVVNAAFLTALFWDPRTFPSAKSAIAYCGLDVVLKTSGRYKGKCKLSKRGWALIRAALVIAVWSARTCKSSNPFKDKYLDLVARGLTKTGAACAVARKYIATAWSMAVNDAEYDPQRVRARAKEVQRAA